MFKVYWTDEYREACFRDFEDMSAALNWAKFLRDNGCTFVTMVSENPDVIGKAGVDSVENGLLPNGEKYVWKKRRI